MLGLRPLPPDWPKPFEHRHDRHHHAAAARCMMVRSSRSCVRTERRSEEGTSCRATIAAKRSLDDRSADPADYHVREHDQRCHRCVALSDGHQLPSK